MSGRERFVVLGLAHTRSPWFAEVGRWATAAALPVEFVKCVSAEELRARLGSGRAFSAALLDASLPGVDRDLVDLARSTGCPVLLVDDGRTGRDWLELGAAAVLDAGFGRGDLFDALRGHAQPIARGELGSAVPVPSGGAGWQGHLVAVTGVPGAGTSTVAAALAQGLGDDPRHAGVTLLADLALHAHQAVLHDAGDVVPGLPELVDAHRFGQPSIDDVRSLTFDVADRGYQLLLGLRRHRDWTAVRPRAAAAALASLRRSYRVVVADVDADLEGDDDVGSTDVEDRNTLARTAISTASAVLVVGEPGVTRMHALVRRVEHLLEHGVDPTRLVVVLNHSPRSPRARAELTRALASLLGEVGGGDQLGSPLHLPERRGLDDLVRDARRLPSSLAGPVTAVTTSLLDLDASGGRRVVGTDLEPAPVPVAAGSLGTWSDPEP
jgi:hypothetical protein